MIWSLDKLLVDISTCSISNRFHIKFVSHLYRSVFQWAVSFLFSFFDSIDSIGMKHFLFGYGEISMNLDTKSLKFCPLALIEYYVEPPQHRLEALCEHVQRMRLRYTLKID